MVDASTQSTLALAVEKAVNTALRYDPATRRALADLQGQVLAVEVTKPTLTLYVVPGAETVTVLSQYDGEVTTRIKGSAWALGQLARGETLNLADSGVEVFGSTTLLMELQKILKQLDIDWEEPLTTALGDVAGHSAAGGIRAAAGWLTGRRKTFHRLLAEYLTEELKTTPSRPELEDYYAQVDELRLHTDRLEARLQRLKQKGLKQNREQK